MAGRVSYDTFPAYYINRTLPIIYQILKFKRMKNFIPMMALLLIGYTVQTQSLTYHNPAVADAQVELNDDNEYGQLSFNYKQELSGFTSGMRHTVKMTVCLLNVRPTNGVQSIGGEIAEKFDWQYDETVNCFLATQSGKLLMKPVRRDIHRCSTEHPVYL